MKSFYIWLLGIYWIWKVALVMVLMKRWPGETRKSLGTGSFLAKVVALSSVGGTGCQIVVGALRHFTTGWYFRLFSSLVHLRKWFSDGLYLDLPSKYCYDYRVLVDERLMKYWVIRFLLIMQIIKFALFLSLFMWLANVLVISLYDHSGHSIEMFCVLRWRTHLRSFVYEYLPI